MNDRELLALAAKAQGWFDYPTDSIEQGSYWHTDREKVPFDHCFPKEYWNPLEDDGDALRLAIRLEMDVSFGLRGAVVEQSHGKTVEEIDENEPYAANRRAIVRAAAEIGRRMK